MALTPLQIHKLLPKTNCKECGSNTCMAFAMKLAAKKAALSECPYASDEASRVLGAAAEPPVRAVRLGPSGTLVLGEETVLYRHEKTFVHPTALAVDIPLAAGLDQAVLTLTDVKDYALERVGETMGLDMVSITHGPGDSSASFAEAAKLAWTSLERPLVLRSTASDGIEALLAAGEAVKGSRSVLYATAASNPDALAMLAQATGHALAITAADTDTLVHLATALRQRDVNDLLLALPALSLAEAFQLNTIARTAAIKDSIKALGYPLLRYVEAATPGQITVQAVTEILKYGSVCVLPNFDAAQLAALFALRQNIYTDPQKPIQVEPRVYAVGEPDAESPVFVTTNFSLTYFLVAGEIENSGLSAWLAVPDCEGMSVLTAWAAGKFSGAQVARFILEAGLDSRLTRKRVVIPGYSAVIRGELEDGLPGWEVMVGPQEAGDLEAFVKAHF